MPAPTVVRFDMGCVTLSAYDADGFLGLQYDAEGEGNSGVHPYESHPTNGCWHRPIDPIVDSTGQAIAAQSATVLFAMHGGEGHAIALGDPRTIAQLPLIQKGETILFSDFGSFFRMFSDGSIGLSTTDKGGSPDGVTISQLWSSNASEGRQFTAPWGTETFDELGWRVRVPAAVGDARITLSSAGGIVPDLSTTCRISADMIVLDGLVSIGPKAAGPEPVVQVGPMIAILEQILAALNALSTAIGTAVCAAPGSPLVAAGLPAAVTAIGTVQSSVGSALETLATQTAIS